MATTRAQGPIGRQTVARSMRRSVIILALPFAGWSAPAAQSPTIIDPPLFAHLTGARATGYPLGYANRRSVRYLEIRDRLAGAARTIQGIAWRRTTGGSTRVPAFDATCTVRLSTAPHLAASVSSTFAANVGGDVSEVLNNQHISFGATVASAVLPAFEYRLPATQPYMFGGLGPLCVDVEVRDHTNRTNFTFDLFQQGRPYTGAFGKSCGGTDLAMTLTTTEVRHESSGLPGFTPLLFIAGLPLAAPLDLSAVGAPGCTSLVRQSVVLAGTADAAGRHSISFPTTAARPGDFYACQVAVISDGLNPLGVFLTQAGIVMPIASGGTGRVFADAAAATTGTAQPVFGLVLGLY